MRRWLPDSRVGLRMLGLFVMAAGAPLLLLAVLSQQAIEDNLARSEALVIANTAKSSGRQTLERLRAARQRLEADQVAPARHSLPSAEVAPLLAVVAIDAQGLGRVLHGGPRADSVLALPPASYRQASRGLHLLSGGDAAAAPAVLLTAEAADGSLRLGLVDPVFLWDGFDEMPAGHWQCAFTEDARPLHCSDPAMAGVARQQLAARESTRRSAAVKGLFLGADFGAPDWFFVAGVAADRSADAEASTLRRTLPIAAAAALLLAVLLALVQLRRTMGPLVRLTAGAREIASRRFGTRINLRSRDEFGELAAAFNDMSGRLQAQFDELAALAEIDRAIVARQSLAAIHGVIVMHLQSLLPGRTVVIARTALDPDAEGRLDCLVRLPSGRQLEATARVHDQPAAANAATADTWQPLASMVQFDAAEIAPDAVALPLYWGERFFGFVAVAPAPDSALDEGRLRQVLELRNRAAVAASAAEHERRLRSAARKDTVTGLLNRHGLNEELVRLIAAAGPGERALAVLFVDLDRFKNINDSLGHAAGDQALHVAAERLLHAMPAGGVAARPAGDEFVLLLPDADVSAAAALADAVCAALAHPMVLSDTLFSLRASVGIALCDDPATAPERLLRNADQAMYLAKRRGGGRFIVFDAQIDALARRRTWIETELPHAAERGQLHLQYQPRVERTTGRMTSVEALVRWHHPVRGLCGPSEFIPIAEETDLIEHLGRWIIDTACAQVRAWRDVGVAELRVAINLSARQITSDALLPELRAAIARHGIRPQDLEIEITEGMLLEQTDSTLARLRALRTQGMTIALDDFGTGYSSMSYLRSLPIDVLKIDRAFVKDLGRDRSAMAIARAIVALASSLGLRTVAEGVEDTLQWQALAGLGCDEVQGFLVSRPVEADEVRALLADPQLLRSTLAAFETVDDD